MIFTAWPVMIKAVFDWDFNLKKLKKNRNKLYVFKN